MKKLWFAFIAVIAVSFAVLGWIGVRIYQEAPPVPDRVETTDGRIVIDAGAVAAGQDVWRAMGGMEVGSIWGHGSYVAPDWTADYLHREAAFVLDRWSRDDFSTPVRRSSTASARRSCASARSRSSGRIATTRRGGRS